MEDRIFKAIILMSEIKYSAFGLMMFYRNELNFGGSEFEELKLEALFLHVLKVTVLILTNYFRNIRIRKFDEWCI